MKPQTIKRRPSGTTVIDGKRAESEKKPGREEKTVKQEGQRRAD